jgi:predicted DNA-binding protein (UPF0251 family)
MGDVIGSRRNPPSATAWLRILRAELHAAYPPSERLARFEFTQGDEMQGLLAPDGDPLRAVLRAGLHPQFLKMRWVGVFGEVEAGRGPATHWSGPAFFAARELITRINAQRIGFALLTGDPLTDELLDDLTPLLADLLAALTPRQREIARLLIIEELRRSEAADRLRVSRATISVAADRAMLRRVAELADAIRMLFRMAVQDARARARSTDPV